MVHQNLAHQARCYSKKVRTVLPTWVLLIYQSQVIVHEGCHLQSVALALDIPCKVST